MSKNVLHARIDIYGPHEHFEIKTTHTKYVKKSRQMSPVTAQHKDIETKYAFIFYASYAETLLFLSPARGDVNNVCDIIIFFGHTHRECATR